MTIKDAEKKILVKLLPSYGEGEAIAITDLVMEHLLDSRQYHLLDNTLFTEEKVNKLSEIISRLERNEPVQYVLGEAWFGDLKLFVNQNVLIPRSETEELVHWIASTEKDKQLKLSVLDIGTGSGCISILLKRKLPGAKISGCDISAGALEVAKLNASKYHTDIDFKEINFLDEGTWRQLPKVDIIVSNPPYIPSSGKVTLHANVYEYEPEQALFVPDKDPLIFYRAIAKFGKSHLESSGRIYVEIHEDLGNEVMEMFREQGYLSELKKDMQQKDRMIRAGLPVSY